MEYAIDKAMEDSRVKEIHLVVRSTEQQTYVHDLYITFGMSRQLKKHSKNRVQMDNRLGRDEQY